MVATHPSSQDLPDNTQGSAQDVNGNQTSSATATNGHTASSRKDTCQSRPNGVRTFTERGFTESTAEHNGYHESVGMTEEKLLPFPGSDHDLSVDDNANAVDTLSTACVGTTPLCKGSNSVESCRIVGKTNGMTVGIGNKHTDSKDVTTTGSRITTNDNTRPLLLTVNNHGLKPINVDLIISSKGSETVKTNVGKPAVDNAGKFTNGSRDDENTGGSPGKNNSKKENKNSTEFTGRYVLHLDQSASTGNCVGLVKSHFISTRPTGANASHGDEVPKISSNGSTNIVESTARPAETNTRSERKSIEDSDITAVLAASTENSSSSADSGTCGIAKVEYRQSDNGRIREISKEQDCGQNGQRSPDMTYLKTESITEKHANKSPDVYPQGNATLLRQSTLSIPHIRPPACRKLEFSCLELNKTGPHLQTTRKSSTTVREGSKVKGQWQMGSLTEHQKTPKEAACKERAADVSLRNGVPTKDIHIRQRAKYKTEDLNTSSSSRRREKRESTNSANKLMSINLQRTTHNTCLNLSLEHLPVLSSVNDISFWQNVRLDNWELLHKLRCARSFRELLEENGPYIQSLTICASLPTTDSQVKQFVALVPRFCSNIKELTIDFPYLLESALKPIVMTNKLHTLKVLRLFVKSFRSLIRCLTPLANLKELEIHLGDEIEVDLEKENVGDLIVALGQFFRKNRSLKTVKFFFTVTTDMVRSILKNCHNLTHLELHVQDAKKYLHPRAFDVVHFRLNTLIIRSKVQFMTDVWLQTFKLSFPSLHTLQLTGLLKGISQHFLPLSAKHC